MSKSHKAKTSSKPKSTFSKYLSNALRFLVSCIAIGLLIWMFRDRLHGVGQYLRKTNFLYLSVAFLCYIFTLLVLSYRLHIFGEVHQLKLNVKDCFYLTTIAHFFNNFLPSSMGGDVVKVYYAYKKTKKKVESFVAVLMDRFCGLITFVFFALMAILIYGNQVGNQTMFQGTILACLISVLIVVFIFNKRFASRFFFILNILPKKIRTLIKDVYYGFHEFRRKKKALVLALLVSLVGQFGVVLANFYIAKSLGLSIHLFVFFLMVPLVNFVSLFAPSINGLGIREGAYVYFFSRFMPAEAALALSIIWYGLLLIMSFLGGCWYAFKGQLNVAEITEAVESEEMEELLELNPPKQ
jgi:uncharacterized protein (TIRG00374 family)